MARRRSRMLCMLQLIRFNCWNAGIWQPAILFYQKDSLDLVCSLDAWCFFTSHIRHVETSKIFILTVSPSNPMVTIRFPGNPLSPTTCISPRKLYKTTPAGKYMDKYPFNDCGQKTSSQTETFTCWGPKKSPKNQRIIKFDHQKVPIIWKEPMDHQTQPSNHKFKGGIPWSKHHKFGHQRPPRFADGAWWNPHLQWSTIQFVNFHRGILDDNGLSKRGQSVHKKNQRPA